MLTDNSFGLPKIQTKKLGEPKLTDASKRNEPKQDERYP